MASSSGRPMDKMPGHRPADDLAGDERLYRLFFEKSSDAFYIVPMAADGSAGIFVDVNQRACEMLGYSRAELLTLTVTDIEARTAAEEWDAVSHALSTEGRARFCRNHLTRGGKRIPVEISARNFERDGQVYTIFAARDISERHAAEQRLRESQRDLEALIDSSLESCTLVEPDTTILRVNKVGADRYNTTPEALVGKRVVDVGPGNIARQRTEMAREVVEKRRTIVFRDYRAGMWLENTVSPILDDAEATMTRAAIFSRDVTLQHLRQEADTLLNNIDRFILDGARLGVLVTYACEQLIEIFQSPLVRFESRTATADIDFCLTVGEGRAEPGVADVFDQGLVAAGAGEARPGLKVVKAGDCPGGRILPGIEALRPASLATLTLSLPNDKCGRLYIASAFTATFDPPPVQELLEHIANRLELAFEMVADQQELALVRQALESAHSAVFITDREGRIIWHNKAFAETRGYAPEEIADLSGELPASESAAQDPFGSAVQTGLVWSGETTDRRRDGSEYTVLQTVTPVFDESGDIAYVIAIQEDISERKRNEERIRFLAEHDVLTGLSNRGFLIKRLRDLLTRERRQAGRGMALLYLDIDHFKQINDHHGHAFGDALLTGFADRLRQVVRGNDLICRIGGDEFVLVLMDIREAAEAEAVADNLLSNLANPIVCRDRSVAVTTSIGICLASGDEGGPEALLHKADAAMYEAKRLGRSRFCSADQVPL